MAASALESSISELRGTGVTGILVSELHMPELNDVDWFSKLCGLDCLLLYIGHDGDKLELLSLQLQHLH